jgi:hypothetical protein
MTPPSFREIVTSTNFRGCFDSALILANSRSFSSDCNGVFGADFELQFCNQINSMNLGFICMTNKELDFFDLNSDYSVDCSKFSCKSWNNLKKEMKNLYHPISVSDVYLVRVDSDSKIITIEDGLSIKTSISRNGNTNVFLHNDANGGAWSLVHNLVNGVADANSNLKIGNILIIRGNSTTGVFNFYFFDGTIESIYRSFAQPPKIGAAQNYVFSHKTQSIIVTNRSVKGTGTSFNRGIQVKNSGFDILVGSGAIVEFNSGTNLDFKKIGSDYMKDRFGF